MKRAIIGVFAFALTLVVSVAAQSPGQHFAKDGLSFQYPSGWTMDESKTTAQMQYLMVGRDGYATIFVRSPQGTDRHAG